MEEGEEAPGLFEREKEQEREREVEKEREVEPRPQAQPRPAGRQRSKAPPRPPAPARPPAMPREVVDDAVGRRIAELEAREAAIREREEALYAREEPAAIPGRFRVSLPGVKVSRTVVIVEPREGSPKHADRPTVEYDGLALVCCQAGKPDPQGAAWQEYARVQGLEAGERKHFRQRVESRGLVDHLEVEALTEADAFATFRRVSGILSTDQQPRIERVG